MFEHLLESFILHYSINTIQKQCSSQQTRQQIPSLTIVLHLDTSFQLSPNLQESERKQCNAMPKKLKVFWPIRRDLPPCVSSCYLLEEEDLPLSIKVGSRLTFSKPTYHLSLWDYLDIFFKRKRKKTLPQKSF